MKRLIILLISMLFLFYIHAQEIDNLYPLGMKWAEDLVEDGVFSGYPIEYEIGESVLVNDVKYNNVYINGKKSDILIRENNGKVYLKTNEYQDDLMIYDFNVDKKEKWYNTEYLIDNDGSFTLSTKQTSSDYSELTINDKTIQYTTNYEGTLIRNVGYISSLNRNSSILGYKEFEPHLPGLQYWKVIWILKDGVEIFHSDDPNEWISSFPTDINEIQSNETTNIIYDLSGRRLNAIPEHGIYIQGGKKIILK